MKEKHPTYGAINFTRTSGTPRPLFGTSIMHHQTIVMEVRSAILYRDLNQDYIHGDRILLRAEMSPTQFADMITGLNTSETPVTLRYLQGPIKGDPPYHHKVEQFNKEFSDKLAHICKIFDDIILLAEETKAQKRLIKQIKLLKMNIEKNLPFINEQFTEQMEKTIKEAKGELEAFVSDVVRQYGLEALKHKKLPEGLALPSGEEENDKTD